MDALTTSLRGAVAGVVLGLALGLGGTLTVLVLWVVSANDADERGLAIGWGFFVVVVGSVTATMIGGAAGAASALVAHQSAQRRSLSTARRAGATTFAALVALGAASMTSAVLLSAGPMLVAVAVIVLVAYALMIRAMARVLPRTPEPSGQVLRILVVLVAAFVGFWLLAMIGGGLGEAAGLGRDGSSVAAAVTAALGALGAGLLTWWATAGSERPSRARRRRPAGETAGDR